MRDLGHPSPSLVGRDLVDAWRVRSEIAHARYETASARYRKLLDEKPEGLIPRPDNPLALARHAQFQALEEYLRILKIFTELSVNGGVPEEAVTAIADGGRA